MTNARRLSSRRLGAFRAGCCLLLLLILLEVCFLHVLALRTPMGWGEETLVMPEGLTEFVASLR